MSGLQLKMWLKNDLITVYKDQNISNGIFDLTNRSINLLEEAEAMQVLTRKDPMMIDDVIMRKVLQINIPTLVIWGGVMH